MGTGDSLVDGFKEPPGSFLGEIAAIARHRRHRRDREFMNCPAIPVREWTLRRLFPTPKLSDHGDDAR
jgi:hypothetical protein